MKFADIHNAFKNLARKSTAQRNLKCNWPNVRAMALTFGELQFKCELHFKYEGHGPVQRQHMRK